MKKKISNRSKLAIGIQIIGLFLLGMNIGSNIKNGTAGNYLLPIGISLIVLGLGMNITESMKNKRKDE